MENTGYKIATKIKVTKKSGSSVSEKFYTIGMFKGGVFVPYSSETLSKLTPKEYKECVRDTRMYIMSEEDVSGDMVEVNEDMVQDYGMCPVPLPMNVISVSGEIESTGVLDSENYIWLRFEAKYEVASDLYIKLRAEGGSYSGYKCVLKKGEKTVRTIVDSNISGKVASLELSLTEDSVYRYSIQPTVDIPKLGVLVKRFNPVVRPQNGRVELTYMPAFGLQTSDVVIRVSINEDGKESYFDILKRGGDGTTNMYDVPANFLGKTANVRIYSVNGVVGETSDSRYRYEVEPELSIPDILQSNKLDASVRIVEDSQYDKDEPQHYRPVLTITSEDPVASDLEFEVGNVNSSGSVLVPYPVMRKGAGSLEKKLPYSCKGRDIDVMLYSVGGVSYKGYDDKYRYHLDVKIRVPEQ